ncbi:MAG: hydantoinase/oxoprolinase family protein [Christensenellaceae bacterium]|nr:hydantoinase/oxoprolinase family protein [Christensenellaceae bacterium]
MKLGIGIDTGGTYTDAVIYDFEEEKILASSKSLTTKEDLEKGILGAIDQLPSELIKKAELISLSTTLATNACVEDRVGNAKLVFMGHNTRSFEKYGEEYGLPNAKDITFIDCDTLLNGKVLKEPDWDGFKETLKDGFDHISGIGLVEMNAMHNGAVIEKKAKQIVSDLLNTRVVCGHELFQGLNSLQRSASTLLNAGLFPVIEDFLNAIRSALLKRGVNASIVVVRSNGSMMTEEFASAHPVETLLCGPAASVLGSFALCSCKNSIIVDIGGTTTDVALIKNGAPVYTLDGIKIGRWKTFVNGLYIKTIGLGGDSAIHYNGSRLILEPYRVVPICMLADKHPEILKTLKYLLYNKVPHTRFLYEHYILQKSIGDDIHYTEEERALCKILENGPLSISAAAEAVGLDVYTHDVSRLIKEGIIQKCGLTPTDIMHIRGDFNKYSSEASMLAAKFVAKNLAISVNELCDRVYRTVEKKIYTCIMEALLENEYSSEYGGRGVSEQVRELIGLHFDNQINGGKNNFFTSGFSTDYKLIGIGAPTHIFLDNVARMLGTEAIIPEYSGVANALGAIVGKVETVQEITIRPTDKGEFNVHGLTKSVIFEKLEEAVVFAEEQAKEGAEHKAREQGASGKLTITCEVNHNDADSQLGAVYLGSTITAKAVGSLNY